MRRILVAFVLLLGLHSAIAQSDEVIEANAQRALKAYSITSIHLSVQHGLVTLTGSVALYRDRLLAEQTLSGIPGIKAIWDRVRVTGPAVPDGQLKAQVTRVIADRLRKLGGLGFGSISARVRDGVVTLTGTATAKLAFPVIQKISEIAGVRNVIDHVQRVPDYDSGWPNAPDTVGAGAGG